MKFIKSFKESILLEKSIGSEAIRDKYYSDLPKNIFYAMVNLDPTSVRKKDFSKPGKYTKWIVNQYKKGRIDDEVLTGERYSEWRNLLNKYLFIFSTGWFKSQVNKGAFTMGGKKYLQTENDIFKYELSKFTGMINKYVEAYEAETENAKYDTIYSDDKVSVLVPLNFSGAYETAKNTEWCSKSFSGYSMWNERSILFRIIPKDKKMDIVKLTWDKGKSGYSEARWFLACSKYPEITGYKSPFKILETEDLIGDQVGPKEYWESELYLAMRGAKPKDRWYENGRNIRDTMSLLSSNVKKLMEEYHNKLNK